VGCEAARRVAIVDPRRDVDVYLDWLAARRFALDCVLETHVHADFASGARELAERTGARLLLSRYDEGERYEVAFPHTAIGDGDVVELGRVRVVALHTPGHTPEHLSFLVFDGARTLAVPIALLSGDFLFVGSLGRPDLLGEEAKQALARALFRSVRTVLGRLPDGLEIHPGHGAGSMCGAGMSARPFSTLGFERIANPYLDPDLGEEAFVARILGDAPPFPPYYRRMKELNARGPRTLHGLPGLHPLPPAGFRELAEGHEHVVVDVRDALSFGAGHVPGSLWLGVDELQSTWAGWTVPPDRRVLLVGHAGEDLAASVRALVRVGVDELDGVLDGGFEAWVANGYPLATLPQLSVQELSGGLGERHAPTLLDVREAREWRQGHVGWAAHVFAGDLVSGTATAPAGPLALMCAGGYRSTVVASALQRAGRRDLWNVTGGMGAWRRGGLPVEKD
jgi:hydroxyacylglutathione hydrolase